MPRGWAGCWWQGTSDTGVGSACGDSSGVGRAVGAFAQGLLITFCWQLMAQDEEGHEPQVPSEQLWWEATLVLSSLQTKDGPWS